MIRIIDCHRVNGKDTPQMEDSLANVFVFVFGRNHQNRTSVYGEHQAGVNMHMYLDIAKTRNQILESVGEDQRPGRLWIDRAELSWPGENVPGPNGKLSRNVWYALIPATYDDEAGRGKFKDSVQLLVAWAKATNLPLKIAFLNAGIMHYDYHGPKYHNQRAYNDLIREHFDAWDVEIYDAAEDYALDDTCPMHIPV